MLYHEPKISNTTDLNARYLPGRSRPQNQCITREGDVGPGYFAYSHCAHDSGVQGSLQKFIIYCYPPRVTKNTALPDFSSASSGFSASSSSSDGDSSPSAAAAAARRSKMPFSTVGMCAPSEICIDGRGDGNHYDGRKMRRVSDAQLAFCVGTDLFVDIAETALTEAQQPSSSSSSSTKSTTKSKPFSFAELPALEGERASMVFSDKDAKTPVEVQEMDLLAGKGNSAGAPPQKVQGSCADCVDLFSGKFEPGTDALKAEATVMGVGSAAAAAVLWIAIVSG